MKIPIFEEIIIENCHIDQIQDRLTEGRIGIVPIFISINHLEKEEKLKMAKEMKDIFLKFNLNPRFPYPTYLISNTEVGDYFPQVKLIKDLPEHFFRKVKRPSNKEIQLLNKLSLKVEKIKNLDMNRIYDNIKEVAHSQKKLYSTTKELYFLELLNYKIFEHNKERNKNGKKN